jgi:hypothetical protein
LYNLEPPSILLTSIAKPYKKLIKQVIPCDTYDETVNDLKRRKRANTPQKQRKLVGEVHILVFGQQRQIH